MRVNHRGGRPRVVLCGVAGVATPRDAARLRIHATPFHATVKSSPTATMGRCPLAPDHPVRDKTRLLETFKRLCAVVESTAMRKPRVSQVGALQEAAAIPHAMGRRESKAALLGSADAPSNKSVNNTVMMGIPHFEV
jgi:hypothetical protein